MPLHIVRQDITKINADAIVNTTNPKMIGYSGVDYAVHRAAGKKLDAECRKLAPIENGVPIVTDGYDMPCKKIIHISGPVWSNGKNDDIALLENCYRACLGTAEKIHCETVAFPLISSGNYGFPKDKVLDTAVNVIREYGEKSEMTVFLCVFDKTSYELSKSTFGDIVAFITDNYAERQEDFCCDDSVCFSSVIPFDGAVNSTRRRAAYLGNICDLPEEGFTADSLEQRISSMDKGFSEMLFTLIDKKGISDIQCYKKANVSRKTFSKIKCDPHYRPSKETAIAFAIALELDTEETDALLKTAGITLSNSFLFDVIISYFISKKDYDIFKINEVLFDYDQPCLGC